MEVPQFNQLTSRRRLEYERNLDKSFSSMVVRSWKRPSSLLSITINFVSDYLANNSSHNSNISALECLPHTIKNRILKRVTISPVFRKNHNLQGILTALFNEYTHEIDLTSLPLDENLLQIMSKCVSLRRLYLTGDAKKHINPETLRFLLGNLSSLQTLVLTNFDQVNDSTLEHLAIHCLHLKAIDLTSCTNITDEGLYHLAKLSNLTCIKLSNNKITDLGLVELVQGRSGPKLKELRVDGCTNLTDVGLRAVAEHCSNMEVLIFNNCSKNVEEIVNFEGDVFKNLKQLTWTISL